MRKKLKSNVLEDVFLNTDFIKAEKHLQDTIDHLIDQENIPADTVMKVLFEQVFLVSDRYINDDSHDGDDVDPCIITDIYKNNSSLFRRFNSNYAFMVLAQLRITDFLTRCDMISDGE